MSENAGTGTFTTSDGCKIAFTMHDARKAGAARAVLIHPLAVSGTLWQAVVDKLTDRIDVLTYDCRGHGNSQRHPGPYTMDLFARDLAELLDHVGWPDAIVAGCSMGGSVAQAFAGLYPARATGLGLIDTTAWYGADALKIWSERAATARSKGLSALIDFQITRWFSDDFQSRQPQAVRAAREIFLASDVDCYAAACAMLGNADLRHFLGAIQVPVAVVVGEEDLATPVAMAQELHAAIAGATLNVIPKVRHFSFMEAPAQIASEIFGLAERIAK